MKTSRPFYFLLLSVFCVAGVLCYFVFNSDFSRNIFVISETCEDVQTRRNQSRDVTVLTGEDARAVDCSTLKDIETKYNQASQELLKLKNSSNNCEPTKDLELKLKQATEELSKLKSAQSQPAPTPAPRPDYARYKAGDEMRMFGDFLSADLFGVETPGVVPPTVYYVWCGDKIFSFRDYLSVLSIIRVIRPLKLVFFYNNLPSDKGFLYHTWFSELRQNIPHLDMRKAEKEIKCNTLDAVNFVLEQLAKSKIGGVFVGERVLLTFIPEALKNSSRVTYSRQGQSSSEQMIVFVKQNNQTKVDVEEFKTAVLKSSLECHTPEQYDSNAVGSNPLTDRNHSSPCIVLSNTIYPEYIANSTSPFSAVIRSLYYGKPDRVFPTQTQDPADDTPLVNHLILVNPHPGQPITWAFEHYICALSALYVARFERIYVHGDTEPSGKYWDKLKKENVTFVYIDSVSSVFQQNVQEMAHKSDILRVLILYKYGGIYNDNDVIWINPISDDLRRYPTVACLELAKIGDWPRVINNAIIVSKPKAPFLVRVLESFWYYRDDIWGLNSVHMFYKVLERYPDTIYIDKKLQIMCTNGDINTCHPVWIHDTDHPNQAYVIEDATAAHFTHHQAKSIFQSFAGMKTRTGIDATLVNRIIKAVEQAGKKELLDDN